MRMGYLQFAHVPQAEALEAIEPDTITNQRQQKPTGANPKHIAVHGTSLERPRETHE